MEDIIIMENTIIMENNMVEKIEPLLATNDQRYVMFPIYNKPIWDMYKKQVECFWRAEEVDLSKDLTSWATLNNDEK